MTRHENGPVRLQQRALPSIRNLLVLIVSAFVAAPLFVAIANLYAAWNNMAAARAMQTNAEIGDLFLRSAGELAAERGITSTALAKGTRVDLRTITRINELRKVGDDALSSATLKVSNGPDFKGKTDLLAALHRDRDALASLRREIDRRFAQAGSSSRPGLNERWISTATTLIISSQNLRLAAQVVPPTALARAQIMLDLRQAMWVITEYAGRERALIGGRIAMGAPFDTATLATLVEYRGRLQQSWTAIETYERRNFPDATVQSAIAGARSNFFGAFEKARMAVYSADAEGGAYPITSEEWIAVATKGIDSLLFLSSEVGAAAGGYASRVESDSSRAVMASAAILFLALVLGGFTLWTILVRITRPIQSLTVTMSRLAGGDLELEVPSVERQDEVGQMARAVEVFRQVGAANRRLEAEAVATRSQLEQDRIEKETRRIAEAEASLLAENAQRERVETLLLDIIETLPDGVAAFDAEEKLVLFNKAYRDMHDSISDEIRAGRHFAELMQMAVDRGQFVLPDSGDNTEWLEARLKAFRRPEGSLIQHLRDDRWVQVRERRSSSGNTVGVRTDITDLKRAELTIKQQAERDPLTGLYNRSVLNSSIQKACDRAQRGSYTGALVLGDLDDFKSINDTLGHEAGDTLLKEIATRLSANLRSNDMVLRLGGDEFALILPRIASPEALLRLMERVTKRVSQPVTVGSRQVAPKCSLGISLFPDHAQSPGELMKNADIALYSAKTTNRGGCCIFDSGMRAAVDTRDKIAVSLRHDVTAGKLSVALQPQIAFENGSHVGFEALARWSPNGRPVPPADFIPIAEECGLILELGSYVLENTLATATGLDRRGFRFGSIAVNIASAQLKTDGFPEQLAAMLGRYRIAPENLELEITENTLLDRGSDKIAQALGKLKQMGVKIALDDFGTGYASLVHLKRFSVDRLKIDRSFVCDIETSQDSSAISRAIISLAHSLGLKVVAEGVETEEQSTFLRRQRCDFGQGYLFGRPLEGEALVEYFSALKDGARSVGVSSEAA